MTPRLHKRPRASHDSRRPKGDISIKFGYDHYCGLEVLQLCSKMRWHLLLVDKLDPDDVLPAHGTTIVQAGSHTIYEVDL